MSLLSRALEHKEYLVLDGGLATTLELDGHVLDRDLWSAYSAVVAPLSVVNVHGQFYAVGSDIVISSSYQMSYEGFRKKGLCLNPNDPNDPANKYLRASTAYGIAARDTLPSFRQQHAFVASSVGCFGAHLGDGSEYTGQYGVTKEEIKQWHAPKLQVLVDSGADLMAFETIPCVDECKALCSLIAEHDQSRFVDGWMSFACGAEGRLNSGESLEDAIRAVLDPPVEAHCKRWVARVRRVSWWIGG
jgi:homocysteine S-methyltransferase